MQKNDHVPVHFFVSGHPKTSSQASSSWRWFNAVAARAKAKNKTLLRINCDETNVVRGLRREKGLMVHRMKHGTPPLIEDKQEERGSWTHLTFICDDSMVQTKLPQVIVGNEQLLRVQDMSCLESQLPDNVYLVRQKSSWLNEPLFVQVLEWLLSALEHYRKHITLFCC